MKIEIRIDKNCDEPKVIVVTDKVTDEINEIVTRLSDKPSQILAGFKDGQAAVLWPDFHGAASRPLTSPLQILTNSLT